MRTLSFIAYLVGGLIISSHAQSVNHKIDYHKVHKSSRHELCKTRHLEPCRFRNPMNNDCGANAIKYTWCIHEKIGGN
jgi:hypothetical protein